MNNDKLDYGLSGSALSEIGAGSTAGGGGISASDVWAYATRTITGGSITAVNDKYGYALAASSIAASTIAASAITSNGFALTAASQIWNAGVRSITGGSVGIAASGIWTNAITDATKSSISENLLKYDMSTITGEANRSPLNALRFLRNRWYINGGSSLVVTKENDSTTAWQSDLTTTGSSDAIIGFDPI